MLSDPLDDRLVEIVMRQEDIELHVVGISETAVRRLV
jgi:hypothetical protein